MAKRVVLELGSSTNFVYSLSGAANAAPLFCGLPERLPATGRVQNNNTK